MKAIYQEIENELRKAREYFPRLQSSAHEGFAVLLEEVDELKECVWRHSPRKNNDMLVLMRAEAIQVAAMAIRLIEDVIDKEQK